MKLSGHKPSWGIRLISRILRRARHFPGRIRLEWWLHKQLRGKGLSDELCFDNCRFEVRLDDYIGRAMYLNGYFEEQAVQAARHFLQPGDTVWDVGSNQGSLAFYFAQAVADQGKVVCFEPAPGNRQRLAQNLELNPGLQARVELRTEALSSRASTVTLAVAGPDNCGLSHITQPDSLTASKVRREVGFSELVECPAVTGDEAWTSMGCPAIRFIKIDVEGHELQVLRGMQRMLRELPRVILALEINSAYLKTAGDTAHDLFAYLRSLGFEAHDFVRGSQALRLNPQVREADLVFFART